MAKKKTTKKAAGGPGKTRLALSLILNVLIFAFTAYSVFLCFYNADSGQLTADGLKAFRYFTVDSNIVCALAALAVVIADVRLLSGNGGQLPKWVLLFKFVGTVGVTLTMLTCILYLSKMTGGFGNLIRGKELFMHLLTPVLAIVSYVLFEHGAPLKLWTIFLPCVPVAAYGAVYFYMVLSVPKDRGGWNDFYALARNRNWVVPVLVMAAAIILISLVLWGLNRMFRPRK